MSTNVLITRGSWAGEIAGTLFKMGASVMMANSAAEIQKFYPMCSHVLIPGGADISPDYYGQENRWCHYIDSDRDKMESLLVDIAMVEKKPLMGICRGHQMITVMAGGTLAQDIHKDFEIMSHQPTHGVRVQPGSWIHSVAGRDTTVNSYHHQAVDKLPPKWVATAWAYDHVVEAIEHPSLPVISVQWHPEVLRSNQSNDLFRLFLSFRQKGANKSGKSTKAKSSATA